MIPGTFVNLHKPTVRFGGVTPTTGLVVPWTFGLHVERGIGKIVVHVFDTDNPHPERLVWGACYCCLDDLSQLHLRRDDNVCLTKPMLSDCAARGEAGRTLRVESVNGTTVTTALPDRFVLPKRSVIPVL
jgi:hypothetical protein